MFCLKENCYNGKNNDFNFLNVHCLHEIENPSESKLNNKNKQFGDGILFWGENDNLTFTCHVKQEGIKDELVSFSENKWNVPNQTALSNSMKKFRNKLTMWNIHKYTLGEGAESQGWGWWTLRRNCCLLVWVGCSHTRASLCVRLCPTHIIPASPYLSTEKAAERYPHTVCLVSCCGHISPFSSLPAP